MDTCDRVAIVLPAYNEEDVLEGSVRVLSGFLEREGLDRYDLIITDNNSTDRTGAVAERLSRDERIRHHFVARQGKGAAVRQTWLAYDGYDVYCFMDADLSAGLAALPALVAEARTSRGIAIGSRYVRGAQVRRSFRREAISRVYRALFGLLFRLGIRDPQCGFKAVSREVRDRVVPRVGNDGFFFDTELLVRAKALGYSIREIPIQWTEGTGSSVHFLRDVPGFLRALIRLAYDNWRGTLSE